MHIRECLKTGNTDATTTATASTSKTSKTKKRHSRKHKKRHKHKKAKKQMSTYDVTEGAFDDVVELGLLSCMEIEPEVRILKTRHGTYSIS